MAYDHQLSPLFGSVRLVRIQLQRAGDETAVSENRDRRVAVSRSPFPSPAPEHNRPERRDRFLHLEVRLRESVIRRNARRRLGAEILAAVYQSRKGAYLGVDFGDLAFWLGRGGYEGDIRKAGGGGNEVLHATDRHQRHRRQYRRDGAFLLRLRRKPRQGSDPTEQGEA